MTLKQLNYQVETFLYNIERSSLQIANDATIGKSLRVGVSMTDPVALETTLDMVERINNYRSYSEIAYGVSLVYLKYDYTYSNTSGLLSLNEFPYRQLLQTEPLPQTGYRIIPPNLYRDQPNLLLLRPIRTSSAPAEGVLLMEIDAKRFYEFFRSLKPNNGSKFLIADNEGRIVMSENAEEIGSQLSAWSDLRHERLQSGDVPSEARVAGNDYKVSVLTSASNGWRYIALTPAAIWTEKADAVNRLAWGVSAVLIALWIGISFLGSRKLSFPLLQLLKRLPETKSGQSESKDAFAAIGTYIEQTTAANRHLLDRVHAQQSGYRDNLLLRLLHGDLSAGEFRRQAQPDCFPFDHPSYCICVAEADDFAGFKQKYDAGGRSLIVYAWSKLIQEIYEPHFACATIASAPGQIAIVLGVAAVDAGTENTIRELCDDIRHRIRHHLKFSVSIAVGSLSAQPDNIEEQFGETLRMLHDRFWLGENVTITRSDLREADPFRETSRMIVRLEKEIVAAIAQGDFGRAKHAIGQLFDSIPLATAIPPSARGYFAHLLGAVDDLMERMGEELEQLCDYNPYERLNAFETVEEMEQWFCTELLSRLQSRFARSGGNQRRQTVQQAIQYIHEQFETDLSLQQFADRFGVPAYQFSRMFKEETGTSFLDYVIEYRIAKAKEWLIHSDMPIKEMTERLRYATTQNFTRVFKQITGVPPGKYRSDRRNESGENNPGPI